MTECVRQDTRQTPMRQLVTLSDLQTWRNANWPLSSANRLDSL